MRKICNRKNPRTPTETETPSKKLRLFSVKEMFPDEIMTLRGYTMMLDIGRLSCCRLTDMLIQVKPKEIRAQQKCGQPSLPTLSLTWDSSDPLIERLEFPPSRDEMSTL